MDTQSTIAEGHFELKETYLLAGDTTSTYTLVEQLEALGDERLEAAHEAAMAGLTDTPLLELWLKRLDSETLEALYNEYVVECTKAKLLGQRDENAYRANRIREIARREIDYRRTQPPSVQSPALGSQADQPRAERLHRSVPKSRRQTCSQPVER